MANLDNLIGKILEDAKVKAEGIIKDATTEAEKRIADAGKESLKKKEMILNRATNEGQLLEERIISGTNLKIRDESLKAKGVVIDKVMDLVKSKLSGLGPDEFANYLKKGLGDRVISSDEKLKVGENYLELAKKNFPDAAIEGAKGLTGFIIDKNGVLENHSFETLIDYMKEDLEAEAAKLLFKN
ncbi:MAG: V-type ATP synthase subunit E family protein [Clostridiaceae bacterium]